MISVALLLISITPGFASSLPLNSSMDELWKNSVRKGTFLYDQMQSGCFPDKQNPPTFSELRAQNWELGNGDPRRDIFPARPVPPYLSPSVAKFMTGWTKGNDYTGVRLWHKIGISFSSLELL